MKMPRTRRRSIDVPVVSMGDIAFLLTIFFMVCSNFAKEAGIKLTPPKAPSVQTIKEGRVSVAIDGEGQIYLQGQPVPDARSIEWGVAALLQDRTGPEARWVTFKCDHQADKAVFEPVLDAIAKAGGTIVAVGDKAPTNE